MQQLGIINCQQCGTLEQEADFMTKALDHVKTEKSLEAFGMMSSEEFIRKFGLLIKQPL